MKELKFIEGEPPKGFKPDFDSYLFNELKHRLLQVGQGWISFHLIDEDKKKLFVSIYFHVRDTIALSPYRAPFGSAEFSEKLSSKNLFEFLQRVEIHLRKRGIRRIQVKNPPDAYRPARSPIFDVALLNLGYKILRAEINTSVIVDGMSFEKKIEQWELRKWKQSKKAKLAFQKIPIIQVEEVYEFIHSCRLERQQSLSMSLPEMKNAVNAVQKNFCLFGVYQKEEMIAASISIVINKKILYNFYSGHPRKFDTLSPAVFLIAGMYDWCQNQNMEVLDLGTSAGEDKPNFGLLDFKLHLGGTPSAKLTFEKDLV